MKPGKVEPPPVDKCAAPILQKQQTQEVVKEINKERPQEETLAERVRKAYVLT